MRTDTTTADLADTLGLSYRQVDYLTRNGTLDGLTPGSGTRRTWPADTVVRLHVAKALHDAAPWVPWPTCARAVLATDTLPPPKGFVVMRADETVEYVDSPLALIGAMADGGVVADYRLPLAA
jgi:hypothetical protein